MYKIICKDPSISKVYVGHTTNFNKRVSSHKSRCYNPKETSYNITLYKYIRANGGFDNFDIAIIEQCCFKKKHEAITHERYLVNILDAVLNERVPGRTSKEWYEDNKEEVMMRQKQNEHTQQQRSKPFECPCCKCFIRWNDKARHNKTKKHLEAAMLAGL